MGEGPNFAMFLEAVLPFCWKGHWLSMEEMVQLTKYHPSSIRWCLKQLTTGEEGDFIVRKRKRQPEYKGIWEWYIKRKPAQMRFPFREQTQETPFFMGKNPAFQFYPNDWMTDPELSRCSAAARGVLMDVICVMWQCERRGVLTTKGKPWTKHDLAKVVRGEFIDNLKCVTELLEKGALHQAQSGAIFSRRMVRDEEQRASWRKQQVAHRVRMSGDCQPDVSPMSGPSSSSSSSSNHLKRVVGNGPSKKGWVDRDEERRQKNREALNTALPESAQVARNSGRDVPKKSVKRGAD